MNFTPDMLELVLSGKKTQTRRPVKKGEKYVGLPYALGSPVHSIQMVKDTKGRLKWRVNNTYAICPGRGKPAVARMMITRIRCEPANAITSFDARAEGFENCHAFFDKLRSLYGSNVDLNSPYWAITFELVQS